MKGHTISKVFFARSLTNGRAMMGIFSLARSWVPWPSAGRPVEASIRYGTDIMAAVDMGNEGSGGPNNQRYTYIEVFLVIMIILHLHIWFPRQGCRGPRSLCASSAGVSAFESKMKFTHNPMLLLHFFSSHVDNNKSEEVVLTSAVKMYEHCMKDISNCTPQPAACSLSSPLQQCSWPNETLS